jgi:hypothetical protein
VPRQEGEESVEFEKEHLIAQTDGQGKYFDRLTIKL